jgi:hypothetical protein
MTFTSFYIMGEHVVKLLYRKTELITLCNKAVWCTIFNEKLSN